MRQDELAARQRALVKTMRPRLGPANAGHSSMCQTSAITWRWSQTERVFHATYDPLTHGSSTERDQSSAKRSSSS